MECKEGFPKMPIYEYQFEKCATVSEVVQKISEKPLTKCTKCSGKLHKLISQSAFHLKGTGWYVTDYAGKSKKVEKTESTGANDTNATKAPSGESKSVDTPKTSSND